MSTAFLIGQSDVSLYFNAWNEDGTQADSIVYNTTDLFIGYTREREEEVFVQEGEASQPITLADQDSVHADWGFIRVNRNLYRVDFPDAAFLTGVKFVIPTVEAPGVTFVLAPFCELIAGNPRAGEVTLSSASVDDIVDASITALDGFEADGTTMEINGVPHTVTRHANGYFLTIVAD